MNREAKQARDAEYHHQLESAMQRVHSLEIDVQGLRAHVQQQQSGTEQAFDSMRAGLATHQIPIQEELHNLRSDVGAINDNLAITWDETGYLKTQQDEAS